MIKLGNSNIINVYFGNSIISKIYLGSYNIYSITPLSGASYTFPTHIDESSVEDRFYVQTSTLSLSGPWTTLATLSPLSGVGSEINYIATGLNYNTQYWGRIIANNEVGDSSITYDSFEFWTAPEITPDAPTLTVISSSEIFIEWEYITDPNNGGFKIYVDGVVAAEVGPTIREYSLTGLTASTEYDIQVSAFNSNPDIDGAAQADSETALSSITAATTEAPPTSELQLTIQSIDPEHWWRFDESSGTIIADSGSIGTDGTTSGDVTLGVASSGSTFTAARFVVGASVDFGALGSFLSGASYPTSLHMRVKLGAGFITAATLIGKWGDTGANQRIVAIVESDRKLTVAACDGGNYLIATTTSSVLTLSTWHSLSIVWLTSTTFAIYVDGINVAITYALQNTVASLPSASSFNFKIGKDNVSSAALDADLHDVFLIARALTSGEITTLATATN
jgi:hypothetical protein